MWRRKEIAAGAEIQREGQSGELSLARHSYSFNLGAGR